MKKLIQRLTNWELWNFYLLYLPITPVWIWYCIKSRSLWFFSSSNPTITFGGFEGEGKKEMYIQLPESLVPLTTYFLPSDSFESVKNKVQEMEFQFPFIVKPDIGMKGILFRKIDSWEELEHYHKIVPAEYIVQAMITHPIELSVFYYRHPASQKGIVSGFIQKDLLQVTGDGVSTLKELIENDGRAKFRIEEMQHRHGNHFDSIIEKDHVFYLSFAANHNRGARFTNLHSHIDQSLTDVFDKLSIPTQFYYGRYDIKANSIEDLKRGDGFQIIEFNGCGAEPNHIYDCGMSLWDAYSVLLTHWKALYEISKHNHRNGTPYWSFKKGYQFLKESGKHFKLLEQFD